VIRQAMAQAFFSLSLGMGAMLTFASYLSRDRDLNSEAVTISFADFMVAFTAGLVVFPVIFALGLQDQVSASTLGALFIALPGAFEAMGTVGRIVGLFFFLALAVGALTSAISLLEVVASSVIDEFQVPRKQVAIGTGILIAIFGLFSAMSLDWLGLMDAVAGDLFLVVGALAMSIFVGWFMIRGDVVDELRAGAGETFGRFVPAILFAVRFLLPPVIAFVAWYAVQDVWGEVVAFFARGG
jgi:neurotransmitter:Na+ symporter, NSS family